jgi:hypothetical protein
MAKAIRKLCLCQVERAVPVTFPFNEVFVYTVGDQVAFPDKDLYVGNVTISVASTDTATTTWAAAKTAAEAAEGI